MWFDLHLETDHVHFLIYFVEQNLWKHDDDDHHSLMRTQPSTDSVISQIADGFQGFVDAVSFKV